MRFPPSLERLIRSELAADAAHDDVTAALLDEEGQRSRSARIVSRKAGVFCGEAIVEGFSRCLGGSPVVASRLRDGRAFEAGTSVAELQGPAARILSVERTLLNLLSLSCGVATETRKYLEAVQGLPTRILATRKTLPGLRDVQLLAVQAGGATVHRRSLSDGILIKENHGVLVGETELIRRARERGSPLHRIEIEVQDLAALDRVLVDPPEILMLDNFSLPDLREAVRRVRGRALLEASGGITLSTVRAVAETGVDFVSVGALTHSAPSLDLGLDFAE